MKHKPYENWILDNTHLSRDETILLKTHIKTCSHCHQLQSAWMASEAQLHSLKNQVPKPGFTHRWQTNLIHRREHERSKQVRRILLFLVTIMVVASTLYMLQNNLFTTWVVSAISLSTSLFFNITKALAGFNAELSRSPVLFYGFSILTFGAVISFLAAFVFFIWNLLRKNRRAELHEAEN